MRWKFVFSTLFISFSISAEPLKSFNLSVEIESIEGDPQRAEVVRALEKHQHKQSIKKLDVLEQDLLFMRKYKSQRMVAVRRAKVRPKKFNPAAKTILFLDLNFAPAEIVAAQAAAQQRGENFLLYPERTEQQQKDIEILFRAYIKTVSDLQKCTASGGGCEAQRLAQDEAHQRLNAEVAKIERLDAGSFARIAGELASRGIRLSSVIFSGHSSGGGDFLGTFGYLSNQELEAAWSLHPFLFQDVSSVLLWGCYSGTLKSLSDFWRSKFPSVTSFMGYRNRAPLGIRASSGRLLKSFLLNESQLATTPALKDLHKAFRSLDVVADLDGAAVIHDFYLAYDVAGKVSELLKSCQAFNPEWLKTYQCYMFGDTGCEEPPLNHLGPLRDLYSFLQVNRHCQQSLEIDFGAPKPEEVIRLIYAGNVRANFVNQYAQWFQIFEQYAANVSEMTHKSLEVFRNSNRAQDRLFLDDAEEQLYLPPIVRDYSFVNLPGWESYPRLSRVIRGFRFLFGFYSSVTTCIPFSWVEPLSKDPDTCGARPYLTQPTPSEASETLNWTYFDSRWGTFRADHNPALDYLPYANYESKGQLRESYIDSLAFAMERINSARDATALELGRLTKYEQLLADAQGATGEEIFQLVVKLEEDAIVQINKLIAEAHNTPQSTLAIKALNENKYVLEASLINISALP